MKKLFSTLAIMLTAATLFAQTADDIIAKHLEATGGKENWKKVNTVISQGGMNIQGQDVSVTITQIHNKASRQDISVAGMNGYQFTTDKKGWVFMPFQGQTNPEPMTPDDISKAVDDLDIQGAMLDYAAKGHKVTLLGKEEVEGTECYKLKIERKTGGEQTSFIDPETFLVVRMVSKQNINGQEMELVTDLSDYREVDGLKMPFAISQGFGVIVMNSIKINVPVDEKLFADPTQ